ncbi:MAG: four-helix bundle copper-binding protein [Pseudomonadota bacterium]
MKHTTPVFALQRCIQDCLACCGICLQLAMNLCLQRGGRHVQAEHFRLMMACSDLCRTTANFLLAGTPFYRRVCAACAEICEACADSCAGLCGLEDCERSCRQCAASCRALAGDEHDGAPRPPQRQRPQLRAV